MIAAGDELLERRRREGGMPEPVVERVRRKHREQSELEIALKVDSDGMKLGALEREVLRARRAAAVRLQLDQVIDDGVLRELERELDLEEITLEDSDAPDYA